MKKISFLVLFLVISIQSINAQLFADYSDKIRPKMTEEDVRAVLGKPVKTDFYKNVIEYHYCTNYKHSDEFIALFFVDGVLVEKNNYVVTIKDTGGVKGKCQKFVKMGNYKEPDSITEIRVRNY